MVRWGREDLVLSQRIEKSEGIEDFERRNESV
jgi:hypothetical protein